jgi:hypothetical protein
MTNQQASQLTQSTVYLITYGDFCIEAHFDGKTTSEGHIYAFVILNELTYVTLLRKLCPVLIFSSQIISQLKRRFHTVVCNTFSPIRKKTILDRITKPFISDKTKSLKNFPSKILQSYKQSPCEAKKLQIIKMMDKLIIRLAISADTKSVLENEIKTNGLWAIQDKIKLCTIRS